MRIGKKSILKDRKEGLKILLINPFGIGDVIFSTSLIEILKKNLPEPSISYICNKRTYGIIEECPMLDNVFVFEKGDYKKLWKSSKRDFLREYLSFIIKVKRERFDIAIDMSMGHQYGFLLKLMGVPERIGFNYKGRGRFHTRKVEFSGFDDKPIGEYYKDLLVAAGFKIDTETRTKIWWTAEDKKYIEEFLLKESVRKDDTIVGMTPGGGISFGEKKIAFKRWPGGKFAELADRVISETGAKVILIWGPGEEALIEDIIVAMTEKPIIAPKTTVRQMGALMSMCNCVVCNDSGPLHVAVASGSATVSVFGPSDSNVYGPYPKSGRNIVVSKDIKCSPCYKKFKAPDCSTLECLNSLNVEDVYCAVKKLLKKETVDAGT